MKWFKRSNEASKSREERLRKMNEMVESGDYIYLDELRYDKWDDLEGFNYTLHKGLEFACTEYKDLRPSKADYVVLKIMEDSIERQIKSYLGLDEYPDLERSKKTLDSYLKLKRGNNDE